MSNAENLFFGLSHDKNSDESINFLETRFQDLSPFSAHEVEVDGEVFKTAEHGYQALRIKPGPERELIKKQRSPMDAWREGQKYKSSEDLIIDSYDKDAIMEELFRAKLNQHDDIKEVLRESRCRELLKVYDTDYYWGTGADGSGENMMGKIWMKLREELKAKS